MLNVESPSRRGNVFPPSQIEVVQAALDAVYGPSRRRTRHRQDGLGRTGAQAANQGGHFVRSGERLGKR